jgi:uncharacterized membrane protein
MKSTMIFPISLVVLIIFYTVGVWGMNWSDNPSDFVRLTPLNLLLTATILFLNHHIWNKPLVIALLVVGCLGFFIEVVGVNTGVVFGEYSYGLSLGLKLFNTPLIIGLNWVILSYCTVVIVRNTLKIQPKWLAAFIAAVLMVLLDFVIEPVAISTDMWTWQMSSVPVTNYIAWFLIAFVFNFVVVSFFDSQMRNKMALPVYLVQLLFFTIILILH